ncbi:MAG: L-cystine uptake protein TcyP (sodium:dicarboxylate symporter family) [Candidatus Azotimanducaceae bacterium]|jgi:L-cystine uptake protein TcyP (sodium:dicarboxylate symporter family)
MDLFVILNLLVVLAGIALLLWLSRRAVSLSRRVLVGLVLGATAGLLLQLIYGIDSLTLSNTLTVTNMLGSSYVNLLKMIIMPLVLVSMVAAVVRIDEIATLGKIGGAVILILIGTTMAAALIGALVASAFGLTSAGLTEGAREVTKASALVAQQVTVQDLSIANMIVNFIPQNIFADLAGLRSTSVIAVVIFGILLGIAGLLLSRDLPEQGKQFRNFVEVAQNLVLRLVRIVIGLTPYGVLALMTKVTATSNGSDILNLFNFVLASYLAIALMFLVHGALLMLAGVNLFDYFRRVWPVLVFAFTSRSSAATIPLNVETQIRELGNDSATANVSASFGATIGQNGCAGIYPAMLAVMIAPSMGIDPLSLSFLLPLIGIVAISSFGVAGVGGGATFAALMVLPALGFPVTLVALLISIEPLIDMARTALNVNGAITAGTITSRVLGMNEPSRELVTEQ